MRAGRSCNVNGGREIEGFDVVTRSEGGNGTSCQSGLVRADIQRDGGSPEHPVGGG